MIVEIATAVTGIATAAGLVFIIVDRVEKMKKRLPPAKVTVISIRDGLALIQLDLRPGEDACAEIAIHAEGLPLSDSTKHSEWGDLISPDSDAHFTTSLVFNVDLPSNAFPSSGTSVSFAAKLRAKQSALVISLTNPRASRWARTNITTLISKQKD